MPRYLFPDGEIQTLSRRAAADVVVSFPLQEIDATGKPVLAAASTLASEIEHLKAHERVGLLEVALKDAEGRVIEIEALLIAAIDDLATTTEDVTVRAAERAADEARRALDQQAADGPHSTEG